jgi:mono/diheme cytochrome c family protein
MKSTICQLILISAVALAGAAPALADHGDCAQPVSQGVLPSAADALYTLQAAVGRRDCPPEVCDVNSDCQVSAIDALGTLMTAVGAEFEASCPSQCPLPMACESAGAPVCDGTCPDGMACVAVPDDHGDDGSYDGDGDDDYALAADATGSYDQGGCVGDSCDDGVRGGEDHGDDDHDGGHDGQADDVDCVCMPVDVPVTSTTMTAPTTTSTSTTLAPTTTTTLAPATTTTTMPSVTSTTLPPSTTTTTSVTLPSTTTTTTTTTTIGTSAGQQIYDMRCMGCHSAGSHDTTGFAGDLAGRGNRLVNDLGQIDGAMSGLMLSDQEITDLAAFLNSL